MNKRSFLKSILLASIAPSLLLSGSKDRFKWKKSEGNVLWVINPDYVSAPFEMAILATPAGLYDYALTHVNGYLKPDSKVPIDTIIFKRSNGKPVEKTIENPWPLRWNAEGKQVYPFDHVKF